MINVQNKRKPLKRLWEPQRSYHSVEFLSEEHLLLLDSPKNHQRGILRMNIGRIMQVRTSKAKSGYGTHPTLSWHAWPPFGGSIFFKEILAFVSSLLHPCFSNFIFSKVQLPNKSFNFFTFQIFILRIFRLTKILFFNKICCHFLSGKHFSHLPQFY